MTHNGFAAATDPRPCPHLELRGMVETSAGAIPCEECS